MNVEAHSFIVGQGRLVGGARSKIFTLIKLKEILRLRGGVLIILRRIILSLSEIRNTPTTKYKFLYHFQTVGRFEGIAVLCNILQYQSNVCTYPTS